MTSVLFPSPMTMHWKKYAAECLGTLALTSAVLVSLRIPIPLISPVIAALTLGLFVYSIGTVSGCHVNPAVTVGLWSIRKIPTQEAIAYIAAQVIGAVLAMGIFLWAYGPLPTVTVASSMRILTGEAVGTAILLFGVCAVVYDRVPHAAWGLMIGGSLLLGILFASTVGNGLLNPAVMIGVQSVSWAYIVGPLLGGVLACQIYRWMSAKS